MVEIEKERSRFRSLILANPNYFGNIKNSPFKAITLIQGNKSYEEIGCVGYHPQLQRLDAVVFINKASGYSGGICSTGSKEYVRFYISYDNGASWNDEGLSSFTARDIPGQYTNNKRLEYAVTKRINPKEKFCFQPNVILAKAILSWNVAPPPNEPHFVPVWGDIHSTHIQIEPRKLIIFDDVFQTLNIKPLPELAQLIDFKQPLPVKAKPTLSIPELQQLYRGKKIEAHRFALPELMKLATEPVCSEYLMASHHPGILKEGVLNQLDINLTNILDTLLHPTDGNTSYEELDCVGLNTNQDTLVGIIRIKKPSGYSGGPCTSGSQEYVAFWGDFNNNGIYETYLGTAAVNVHDIEVQDKAELEYSVFLPVDLEKYRRPCIEGPRVIKIRAILSWNVTPPSNNPNYVPVWGNREETHILIEPGKNNQSQQVPLLSSIGDMAVSTINSSGKATGIGNLTGFVASDSPFGGQINICGKIANGASGSKYRVMKKLHGAPDAAYKPIINNPLIVTLVTLSGGVLTIDNSFPVSPDLEGYYAYQDYSTTHFVDGNLLIRWYSTEEEHGKKYDIRVDLSVDGNPLHDLHSDATVVLVDNKNPDVDLTLDLGVGGQCADFNKGINFTGTFKALDPNFHSYSFEVQPSVPANGAHPVPSSGVSVFYGGAVADPGIAAGTYTFDTTPMKPCGYSLTLHAYGRSNINSGTARPYNKTAVGFCIKQTA